MFVWFCILVCASAGRFVTDGQPMPGQPHDVPVNSTEVLTAAHFAVVQFNRANTADSFAYKIVAITSAKAQVVAGIKYILEMRLRRTRCRKSDKTDGEACVSHSTPKELQCHFVVAEVPGKNSRVLAEKKCRIIKPIA